MQRRKVLFGALLIAAVFALGMPSTADAAVAVSISVFHDQLTPYGHWVVAGSYGNVWVPQVATGWAPYTDGEWVYTDYGWTWVSYDPWGDVPSHYGAWAWADGYGWVWAPGTVWAPAWVTWAYTDNYVGWAPLPPSFAFSAAGYAGAPVVLATSRYCFVPTNQFVGTRVASVRVPVAQNAAFFSRAVKTTDYRVSNGIVRTAGPPKARIEKATSRPIAPVPIDRVKAQPTTLQAAGVAKASRVSIAAPASERRQLTTQKAEAGKPAAAEKAAPKTAEKAAPKSKPHAEAAPKESANRPAAHEAKPSHPPSPPASAHQNPKKKPEPAAEPSGAAAKSAPEKAPNEEARVAHSGKPAAPPHAQPAHPKPAEKKAPPPKEPPPGEQKPGD